VDFNRTYLERDVPQLGRRIPAETLRRFWTMLAHQQGGLLNAASLARALAVDGKTVAAYLDLLVDLLLVRRLPPWHGRVRKSRSSAGSRPRWSAAPPWPATRFVRSGVWWSTAERSVSRS
jgi:predicted AAA+ superfamily ATPase